MTAIGKSIPTKNDHKISKYIDYPNMKELFLSLQRRKGDSLREWSMWHFYNAAACGANILHDA